MRRVALVALVSIGACAPSATPTPTRTASAPERAVPAAAAPASEPAPPPIARPPEAPLPEGALRRLGGTRFRHAGRVAVVAVSPDGRFVASGAGDNSLRVWSADTGEAVYAPTLDTVLDRVEHIAFVGERLVYASGSQPITVVATKTWQVERELATCGTRWVQALAPSPDGQLVAVTCERENELRLQPLAGGAPQLVRGIPRPEQAAWSADGAWIAVVGEDSLHVVDVKARKAKPVAGVKESPHAIAFGPTGAVLAYDAQGRDDKVAVYDVAAAKQLAAYDVHVGATALAFSRDGATLVFAQRTGPRSLVAIDRATGARRELLRPTTMIAALAFGANPRRVWLAHDNAIRLHDLDRDVELLGPSGHRGEITALAYSPDGKTLASGSSDASIELWNLATATPRRLEVITEEWGVIFIENDDDYLKSPLGEITGLAWSKDGARLYSTDGFIGDGHLRLWNPARGTQTRARGLQRIGVRAFGLASDESFAISLGSEDGDMTLRWVDPATGKKQRELPRMGSHAALSPDGTRIAVALDGKGKVAILDARTGKKLAAYDQLVVDALAFSPDSKRLAIGTHAYAHIIDVATGKRLQEVHVDGSAETVGFAPDGRVLVGGYHGDVIIGDVTRRGHTGQVKSLAVAPDGKTLASGGVDGQIVIWPL